MSSNRKALWLLILVGIIGGAQTNRLPQFSQEKRAVSINEEQPVGKILSIVFNNTHGATGSTGDGKGGKGPIFFTNKRLL